VLDRFGLAHDLSPRWGETGVTDAEP
jgi:hypothetical protein